MSVRALPSVRSVTESARVTVEDLIHGGDLPRGLIPHAAPKRASRSEVQIKIDTRVAEVYQQWCDQGKEKVWLRCPHAYYAVPEAKAKDMRDKIRKAGRLLQVQIRFGRADLYNEEGDVLVVFTVVDKSSQPSKDDGQELDPSMPLDPGHSDVPLDPGRDPVKWCGCQDPAALGERCQTIHARRSRSG